MIKKEKDVEKEEKDNSSKDTKDGIKTKKVKNPDNWIYCRLGHLHLLLEQWPKGKLNI